MMAAATLLDCHDRDQRSAFLPVPVQVSFRYTDAMRSRATPPHLQTNPANPADPAVLSVTSLNRLAKSLLEGHFPAVTVEGEISNLARPSSGHWYLTLKDKSSQLRCAMFVNRNRQVRFRPDNGQQVMVRGKLSIYEGRGDYQLIVDSMEEAGDGALRRAFEELKARLAEEGLFAEQHKRQVLNNYRHIGLITSPTGAAIRDLVSVFARRFPATRLTLIPVAVQGQQAAADIAAAIARANRLRGSLGLEALIVGRGGGSLEDLQAFNEEVVARAIHASELPITSAVGHEIDFTIADFVADLRAPTPSAAAELMSPAQQEYLDQLRGYRQVLTQLLRQRFSQWQQTLKALQRHLKRPDRRLQEHAQTLDRLETRLYRGQRQQLKRKGEQLDHLRRALGSHSPEQRLRQSRLDLQRWRRALRLAVEQRLQWARSSLGRISHSLDTVSPLNTLARGYSITYDSEQRVLRHCQQVQPGDTLVTRLADGSLRSTVGSIEPGSAPTTDDETTPSDPR